MPAEDRQELGFDLRGRTRTEFSGDALRALHERLGDQFYEIVGLTKTSLEEALTQTPELLEYAMSLATEVAGPEVLLRRS
jgi:hypothetical protein